MGCCNSKDDELPTRRQEQYYYPTVTASYNRRDINIINDINIPCENTTSYNQRKQQNISRQHQLPIKIAEPTPKIGEYKCKACGRFWTSRYCWPDKYQNCKRCKKPVYAHQYRELKESDYVKDTEDKQPHELELCQMCQQLGYSCTTKRNKYNNKRGKQ